MEGMPPEKRRRMFAAIFAQLKAKQRYLRAAQRSFKGTDYYLGAAEDITGKKYRQTRAWVKVGGMVTGVPQQLLKVAAGAERAAHEAKKASLLAEASKRSAELVAKGMPFPALGRGRPGPGALVPPTGAGYIKWTGKGEHRGMWVPSDLHARLTAAVKVGRKPKLEKSHKKKIRRALEAQAAVQEAAKAAPVTEEKIRRALTVGKKKK